jgi:hypothetical protein
VTRDYVWPHVSINKYLSKSFFSQLIDKSSKLIYHFVYIFSNSVQILYFYLLLQKFYPPFFLYTKSAMEFFESTPLRVDYFVSLIPVFFNTLFDFYLVIN